MPQGEVLLHPAASGAAYHQACKKKTEFKMKCLIHFTNYYTDEGKFVGFTGKGVWNKKNKKNLIAEAWSHAELKNPLKNVFWDGVGRIKREEKLLTDSPMVHLLVNQTIPFR